MELRRYGEILWRYKLLVLAIVAAALAGTWATDGLGAPGPRYRAAATLIVNVQPGQPAPYPVATLRTLPLAREAVRATGGQEDPAEVLEGLEVDESLAPLVSIRVEHDDPDRAAALANGLAAAYLERVDDATAPDPRALEVLEEAHAVLRRQIAELAGSDVSQPFKDGELQWLRVRDEVIARSFSEIKLRTLLGDAALSGVRVFEPAVPPTTPIEAPIGQLARSLGGAAAVALLGALTLAFLLDYVSDTIRTEADVETTLGIPVIATLPPHRRIAKAVRRFQAASRGGVMPVGGHGSVIPDPRLAEAFQSLRVHIEVAAKPRSVRSLLVVAPHGAQKTVVAAFLAAVFARAGRRVALISSDLHRPALEGMLGVQLSPGLGEVATAAASPEAVFQHTWIPGLSIASAGTTELHPADVLASEAVDRLFEVARATSDVVVIEAPPVLASAEAAILVPRCDAMVLVLEARGTTRTQALSAKNALEKVRNGAPLIGAVLTNVPDAPTARRYNGQAVIAQNGVSRRALRRDNGAVRPTGPTSIAEPQATAIPDARVERPAAPSGRPADGPGLVGW